MATIRKRIGKRGNSQWEVRIRRHGYPTTCKTFETKADAEAWSKEIETEMNKGVFVSRTEAERYTLSECLDRYIEEYIPRLKHPEIIVHRARALQRRDIALRVMATIRAKDIADFRREREAEGVKNGTILVDLALFSRLFNYARSDWGMESLVNPVEIISKPKPEKGRERRLEAGEEERLLKASSDKFKPVLLFALATAMRREEIANLKWKNVNLENRCALLSDTKNNETRTIPLSSAALDILRNIPRKEGEEFVFGVSTQHITNAMGQTCKKAGIEDLRFHDLRHEATSRLFENTDLDLMEIRAITGHKTLQMLVRYTHLRTARLADRLEGVGRIAKTG
ncbi:MAG: site-specific integrase [Desulfarculales bacterium]|jgi:integrase|nr:site-specific integrase [Desulfarculales bacterium]